MKYQKAFCAFSFLISSRFAFSTDKLTLSKAAEDSAEQVPRLDDEEFKEYLSSLTATHLASPAPFQGHFAPSNLTEIVDTAHHSYELWADMIDHAQYHIHIFTYFIEDDVWYNGLQPVPCPAGPEVLERSQMSCKIWQAAERGVKVRIIADSAGNLNTSPGVGGEKILNALAEHENVDLINFNPMLAYSGARDYLWEEHRVWLWAQSRNHVKLMVTDGQRAITGGRNIGANYMKPIPEDQRSWDPRVGSDEDHKYRDTEVYIEGPGVAQVQRVFFRNWFELSEWEITISENSQSLFNPIHWWLLGPCIQNVFYGVPYYCKPSDPELASVTDVAELLTNSEFFPVLPEKGDASVLFIDSAPMRAGEIPENHLADPEDTPSTLTNALASFLDDSRIEGYQGLSIGERLYIALIENSREQIKISNPYINLNRYIRKALKDALNRGVEIQIFTNSYQSANPQDIWPCSVKDIKLLLENGAEFYQWLSEAGMMHSKTAVFDDQIAIVGSFNFDGVSFNNNLESLAIMTGKNIIDQLNISWQLDITSHATATLGITELLEQAAEIGLNEDFSNVTCDNLGALM